MSNELIVNSSAHETRLAILENDRLAELYIEQASQRALAGSIFKGRVTRVLPGMQSAFVNIGLERDAFLYVSDFFLEETEEVGSLPVKSTTQKVADSTTHAKKNRDIKASSYVLSTASTEDDKTKAASRPIYNTAQNHKSRRGGRSRRQHNPPSSQSVDIRQAGSSNKTHYSTEISHRLKNNESADKNQEVVEEASFVVLPGESLAKHSQSPPSSPPTDTETYAIPYNRKTSGSTADLNTEKSPSLDKRGINDAIKKQPGTTKPTVEQDPILPVKTPVSRRKPDILSVFKRVLGLTDRTSETTITQAGLEDEQAMDYEPKSNEAHQKTQSSPARFERRRRRRGRGRRHRIENSTVKSNVQTGNRQSEGLKISDLLKKGQEVLVQISKEPLGKKGARITSHIALPGRFLIYMPTVKHIGVSRKISSDKERSRLRTIVQAHNTGIAGGFIVRTAGDGVSEEDLRSDMLFLSNLWLDIREKSERYPSSSLVHRDNDVVERVLRDRLGEHFKTIWVDSEGEYKRILQFVERFQPNLLHSVKLYTRTKPIFDSFKISNEIEKSLRPKVWLKSGGYIVINPTEALVSIDVNTGKYIGKSDRLEDTIVNTNLEAVKEIVRQLRIRDLGGIIVVDFIDMEEYKNRQKVMSALERELQGDVAPSKTLPFNEFGLVAITRKRIKQSLERSLCTPCPYCQGASYIKSVQSVIYGILADARKRAATKDSKNNMTLRVNPEVAQEFKSHDNNYLQELEQTLQANVLVSDDISLRRDHFDMQ